MKKIYFNGTIIPMTKETDFLEALVEENGKIIYTGLYEDAVKKYGNEMEKIDLKGQCLMPGFIDAHSHFAMNGQMSVFADLSECESFDDIVKALEDYIENNKITDSQAVMGFGYDHNFLIEEAHPDKRVLDRVSTQIPIMILHVSAHLSCVNSKVLELADISADKDNPTGGVIGRLEGTNEPSGYLEEAAMGLAYQVMGSRVNFAPEKMMAGIQSIYLKNGITTVQDGATTAKDMMLIKAMADNKMLLLDVIAYPLLSGGGSELYEQYEEFATDYKNHVRFGGYKIVLDGSPQGRSAWMSEPYLGGAEDYCAYSYHTDDQVEEFVTTAIKDGKQILAHCNGDAASEQFVTAYEKALDKTGSTADLRPVMIHCQTVRNDQLDRMAKIKMIASIFVGHVWYWGDIHIKNFGQVRGNHISPVKDAIDRGVKVNFHQDTPVTKPDMLHSIWCAVNRISRKGNIVGKEQASSVYEALEAVTINAAYQYHEEDIKGTLEVGKLADMVILSDSPMVVDKLAIKDIRVLETIKEGKIVFSA